MLQLISISKEILIRLLKDSNIYDTYERLVN